MDANSLSTLRSLETSAKRFAGSFSSDSATTLTSGSGNSGRNERRGLGSSNRMDRVIATSDSPMKGSLPVSSSYKTTPKDQMSVRESTSLAQASCSGDMYASDPMTTPVSVGRVGWVMMVVTAVPSPSGSPMTATRMLAFETP